MGYAPPTPTHLTDAERRLFAKIPSELRHLREDDVAETCEASVALTGSLLKRGAIPKVRLAYFNDRALNISKSNKSLREVFESNGRRGDEIYRHPNFLPYLWYFVNGPNLPPGTAMGFCRILNDDAGTSAMVKDQLRAFVRAETRKLDFERWYAAEEFFKLALELGLDLYHARSVRDAARSTR